MKGWIGIVLWAIAGAALASDKVTVGLAPGRDAEDLAVKLGGWGRIESKDPVSGCYHVAIGKGWTASQAAAKLRKLPWVVLARPSRPGTGLQDADFRDAASLESVLIELRAQNADREAMAIAAGRPGLQKIEKIKTGYFEAYLFWLQERAYPNRTLDTAAYQRAIEHRDHMPPAFATETDGLGSVQFQYVGPTNLDIPYSTYYGIRPINGRASALAVSPQNPNVLYLGGGQGGIFKSLDAGATWTAITDGWEWLTVSSIAIDPSNPQTVYVGTGDYHGGKPYQFGIMKSTDGGSTWTNLGRNEFGTRAVSSIAIDPENPQIVTVATGRGAGGAGFVWRSTNGGTTWTNVLNSAQNWSQISVGALNAGTRYYYVSGGGTGGNVWRSADRGATWVRLTTLAAPATNHSVISVCASPVFPDTVYMVANADRKVFKSVNAGTTWTDITGAFPNGTNNYFWSQSTYNWFLNVSSRPGPQDVIYVGMIDAAQSYDGGATWRSIGGPTYVTAALIHNDQQFCITDPADPNRVYIGGDGGAYRYTFNPSTNTGSYAYLSANLGISMFYKADFHPTNPNYMIGGTQDNATPVAVGNLASWENCGGGDGGFCCINPASPNIQYSTSQSLGVYRTSNYWSTQNTISPSTGGDSKAFIAPIYLDPNNPSLLYAGTNYLWRRNDATGVWEARLGGQLLSASGNLRSIAIANGDSNRIYTGASDGQVWMSTTGGVTWTQINTGAPSLPNRVVNYISVNPANKNEILVSVSGTGTGHLWLCPDTAAASRTWIDVSGSGATGLPNIPANTVCRDFFDFDRTWFVGTDIGMFMTEDGGATWTNATRPIGLPNVQVNDIKVQPAMNTLHAATYGRGMWRLNLPVVSYATSFTVTQGALLGGGLNEVRTSDDARLVVISDEFAPNGEVEFQTSNPGAPATEVAVAVEASAGRTDMIQTVALWDWNASAWVQIDLRSATASDTRFVARTANAPARFVSGAGALRARIRWIPSLDIDAVDGWSERIDRIAFRVVR